MIKRRCPRILSCLCLLILLPLISQSQSKPRFSVRLKISAQGDMKSEIESYISRELRSLGDVYLVDNDEAYRIGIIAFELINTGGRKDGYAVTALITSTFPTDLLATVLSSHGVSKDGVKTWRDIADEHERVERFILDTCGRSDLRKVCEQIVIDFDTKILEPIRKLGSREK